MTVFPALAIVSQNSTMSGNWRGYRHIVKKDGGSTWLQIPQCMPRQQHQEQGKSEPCVCEMGSSPSILRLQGL